MIWVYRNVDKDVRPLHDNEDISIMVQNEPKQPLKQRFSLSRLTPARILLLGYAAIILIGALLLCLPVSSRAREWTPFLSALFTATSATCVTGLIVVPTVTHWSLFGQLILLVLIQIGGMGFLTMGIMITILTRRRIGLRQRYSMQESISAPNLGGIVRLTRFIFRGVLLFEGAGALLLALRFIPIEGMGFFRGLYYAIFHSVSAFCNAGFDLFGSSGPAGSISGFVGDPLVNIVLMLLIVIGGLGFFVWEDLSRCRLHFARWKLHTKLVVVASLVLIFVPAALMLYFDWDAPGMAQLSLHERVFAALFQSVSARTAGFNSIDLNNMSHASQLTMILLMLIGGSSGSTAGGMKTTTLVVLLLCVRASLTRESELRAFGRRIDMEALRSAVTVFVCYLALFLGGGFLLVAFDGISMLDALFETASATATVGLSLGVTGSLSVASRIVLIFLMFFGRVGCMTMIYAYAESRTNAGLGRQPLEKIAVG